MAGIDLERARRETPGCRQVLHFNNAGSSLPPAPVLDAQIDHLRLEAEIGGYEAADRAQASIENVYDAAARLINCDRDEIAMIENATRAWDMAFYSISFVPGDRILTSMAEYASNFISIMQVARRTGAIIEPIPNDDHGQTSAAALRKMIDSRVKLIAVTHIPTNGGLVNPAEEIGAIAREAGILYLLDACQSVGQLPVDVKRIGCDMLSTTGRKYLRGPRGTGFLFVRHDVIDRLEPVMLDLHAATWTSTGEYVIRPDARRFENWETNYAAKIGLGVAIDYALSWGVGSIWERIRMSAERFRSQLSSIPGVTVHDIGQVRGGIVTFNVAGSSPVAIREALAERRINVTISRTASTRLDMEDRGLTELVRASLHYFNSEDEIDQFCATLERFVA